MIAVVKRGDLRKVDDKVKRGETVSSVSHHMALLFKVQAFSQMNQQRLFVTPLPSLVQSGAGKPAMQAHSPDGLETTRRDKMSGAAVPLSCDTPIVTVAHTPHSQATSHRWVRSITQFQKM